ncbi:MAG: PRC-barrel domain containing protein [Rubrivivax sp.]|nr:MAG: PRC-barrel domain containing protein [Rubrivivax sp.]
MQSEVHVPNPTISSSKVEGTDVFNPAGDSLGSIDDLIIDKVSGQVRYAVLEFGGILGMGTDHYPLPWGMLQYDTTKDGYVVDLEKEQLSDAPRYARDAEPEYTEEYGRGVHDYYGTPWTR